MILEVLQGDIVIIPVGTNTNEEEAKKVIAKLLSKLPRDVEVVLTATNAQPCILRKAHPVSRN